MMKTITVKVPEELDLKLAAMVKKMGGSKSELIRSAIEQIVTGNHASTNNSCLDLAKDLAGSVEGPNDLSHNKKHFVGYGQ
jgi:Arc/MetJ-type ribon-helix-helix transcriptional regulator